MRINRHFLFVLAIGVSISSAVTLKDVPSNHYARPYIIELANMGIFSLADGKFEGKATLSRYDFATVLGKFSRYLDEKFDVILATNADATPANPDIAVNSRMGVIDELADQVDTLRNDIKVIEKKMESGGSGLRFNGSLLGAISNRNPDTISSVSRLSYKIDKGAFDISVAVAGYDTSANSVQSALSVVGNATYEWPMIGNVSTALSVGPRERLNALGQVIDFPGNRLRLEPTIIPAWVALDSLPGGTSVVALGSGIQLAALDNLIDLNWQKRYAVSQFSSVIKSGGINDNNDILGFSLKMGSSKFISRMTLGGSHASTLLAWSGLTVADSQLTIKSLTLGSAGISSQLGDTYLENGAIDILGFPIENNSSYFSVVLDKIMTNWGVAVDQKTLNSAETMKAKLSYNVALSEQATVIHEAWYIKDPSAGTEYRLLLGLQLNL